MSSLVYTTSQTDEDLLGIMALQQSNLRTNLSKEDVFNQGFVTVVHTLEDLRKMNDIEQHIICKDGDKIVAYLLAMTVQSKNDLPILFPMFEKFEKIQYLDKPVSQFNYIIVGQACINKNYRGQGILDQSYAIFRDRFKDKYDFAITEISCSNERSLKAHKRIGFFEVYIYQDPGKEEWSVVIWEW